jgi:YidC/Oxa1 family membrane protein insertase
MQDQRNLILAVVLSIIVFIGYSQLFPQKRVAPPPQPAAVTEVAPVSPAAPISPAAPAVAAKTTPQTEILADAPRIPIDTPRLHGSISLAGGRIDDLVLNDYYETTEHKDHVTLLSPAGSVNAYFVEFGWAADGAAAAVPNVQTIWTRAGDNNLTPDSPVTLTWDNGAGLVFERTISVDRNYLFTIKQKVTNHGANAVALHPYGMIVRANSPVQKQSFGADPSIAGYYGSGLDEVSYKDLGKAGTITHQMTDGWVGMNDKYWLVAAVPAPGEPVQATLRDIAVGADHYTVDYQAGARSVAPGGSIETSSLVFAGAKVQSVLADYEKHDGIAKLEHAINFGWFYIIAEPFSLALNFIAKQVGNFGIAILLFNIVLKIVLFPLQDRSFHQMARMKDIQPKIAALKEKFGDDKEKMATAQMELFKKEKINPASGCLPIFAQLPIFYALYHVLSTTIEMRQAPFYGWIHDLSAPDPTTVFNLFGLIPWTPPHFLMLGAWPLIYGGTMYLQQKMTPTPTTDPTQARIMSLMPLVFMFFFAGFPAGLTIYYSWNAVLTIAQMALIRRRSERKKALAAAKA